MCAVLQPTLNKTNPSTVSDLNDLPRTFHPPEGPQADNALAVVRKLVDHGFRALYAGGIVRDSLLGTVAPDIDIATNAKPDQVRAIFPHNIPVGAHFGVVIVIENGFSFEVATFRSDGNYSDGRRPDSVRYVSEQEDAERRDFTINGLFYDPVARVVRDHVGGMRDLEQGIVRAIRTPRDRFQEDKLRLLRAVRFASRLHYQIEPATWEALCEFSPLINDVSAERIRDELARMFVAPSRLAAFDLLDQSGLLAAVLPEVAALKGCDQPPEFHPEGDVFVHTRLMFSLLAPESPLALVWAVLLHDIGKPATRMVDQTGRIRFNGHDRVGAQMAERLLRRLRFSNEETDAIVSSVANHMVFKDVRNMRPAKLRRFMARPGFENELELHRLDCLGCHGFLDNHTFLVERQTAFSSEPLIPPPLLRGGDLIALGLRPGPDLGKALEAVQTAQLDGEIDSKEAAIQWLVLLC